MKTIPLIVHGVHSDVNNLPLCIDIYPVDTEKQMVVYCLLLLSNKQVKDISCTCKHIWYYCKNVCFSF